MSTSQILAYLVIGLAVLLVVGGIVFLVALSAFEKVSDWRVERASRNGVRGKPEKIGTPVR